MNKIKSALESQQMSLSELSSKTGIDTILLKSIVNSTDPTLLDSVLSHDIRFKLADALHLNPDTLKVLYVPDRDKNIVLDILRLIESCDNILDARNKIIERYKND